MTDLPQFGQEAPIQPHPGPALTLLTATASVGLLKLFGLHPAGSAWEILQSFEFSFSVLTPALALYLIFQRPRYTAFAVFAWAALLLGRLEMTVFLWGLGRVPQLQWAQTTACAGALVWMRSPVLWRSMRTVRAGAVSFSPGRWAIAVAFLLPLFLLSVQRFQGIFRERILYPAAEAVPLAAAQGALTIPLPFEYQIALPAGTKVIRANPKDGILYVRDGSFFCAFYRDNRMDQGLRGLNSTPFDLRGLMEERFGMVPKIFKEVCLLDEPDRFLRMENQRILAYAAVGKSWDPGRLKIGAAVWDSRGRSLGAFDVDWPVSMGQPQSWLATLDASPTALSSQAYLTRANAAGNAGRLQEQGLLLACASLSPNPDARTVRKFANYLSGQKLTKAAKAMNDFAKGL